LYGFLVKPHMCWNLESVCQMIFLVCLVVGLNVVHTYICNYPKTFWPKLIHRFARRHIFMPNILIWVNFGGSCNRKSYLVYFSRFGMLYQETFGNPAWFIYSLPTEIFEWTCARPLWGSSPLTSIPFAASLPDPERFGSSSGQPQRFPGQHLQLQPGSRVSLWGPPSSRWGQSPVLKT
jgi:hypothetical protein